MDDLIRPPWLPEGATLQVVERSGSNIVGEAWLRAHKIARILWASDGSLRHEQPFDLDGEPHGLERQHGRFGGFDSFDRYIDWCAEWVHGHMHGLSMMLSEAGLPLAATRFEHGRGVDIWTSDCGEIAEVREIIDLIPDGFVRWGLPTNLSEEEHYLKGQRHGIHRKWDPDRKMKADYPRFYINNTRVSLSEYIDSYCNDSTLQPYHKKDDQPERLMPEVVTEAIERAADLIAEGFSLEGYIQKANEDWWASLEDSFSDT